MFEPRLKYAISLMDIKPGEHVLDVGVGTGLSLEYYPRDCHVTGIDLSAEMLEVAEKRRRKLKLDNVTLLRMDAMDLTFPESTFDHVLAGFFISVVDDPHKVIHAISRVGKPSCPVVFVNHFRNRNHFYGQLEDILCPVCCWLGWRSDLRFEEVFNNGHLRVDERRKMLHRDLWDVVLTTNVK
jgi:phosphatidylethanolamine/phosphatidyl-N-methylethanolamine N-methyltransferase